MMRFGGALILMLFVLQGRPAPGKVNSTYDKAASFQAFKAYSWSAGQPAYDKGVDKAIVDAIDGELATLGLKKVASGGDVSIRYLAVRSTSVDLNKLEALEKQGGGSQASAEFSVGRLVVVMQDGKSAKQVWAADCVERLNPAVAERDAAIKQVVTRMFETYPTRLKK